MRISATLLESFRLMKETDYVSVAELEASIRGVYVPRPEAKLGDALHRILREPFLYEVMGPKPEDHRFICNEVSFPADVVVECLELILPGGMFEVKATKVYRIAGRDVTVVAKADQLLGARVVENKTKWSGFDIDRYADSYQWRFMAEVFEPSVITYNVFCLTQGADGSIWLRSKERFDLYPYMDLGMDCESLLREFVAFVEKRGLAHHLAVKPEYLTVMG